MNIRLAVLAVAAIAAVSTSAGSAPASHEKPTIVLVHGAFAGSSNWNGVIDEVWSSPCKKPCRC